MAYGGQAGLDITLPAAADLSAKQYRLMKIDGSGRAVEGSAAADVVIGILQNKPSAMDEPASIRIMGISKVVAGAALAEGEMVVSNGQGFGTAAAANQVGAFVVGICMAAVGGSADIAEVLVTRFEI